MTTLLSRRGVLRCLTGLIAAPAVIRADALMRVIAPVPPQLVAYDSFGNEYEKYVGHFRLINPPLVCKDWRYVAKIANIEPGAVSYVPQDMFSMLASPAEHRAQG